MSKGTDCMEFSREKLNSRNCRNIFIISNSCAFPNIPGIAQNNLESIQSKDKSVILNHVVLYVFISFNTELPFIGV